MKLWLRATIFLTGVAIFFLAWRKAHNQALVLQNPGSSNAGSAEILVIVGGFVMLMAFAPSQETLGRWMSIKKPKKVRAAQFRRRRQRG